MTLQMGDVRAHQLWSDLVQRTGAEERDGEALLSRPVEN
jgi:hypothetical protein